MKTLIIYGTRKGCTKKCANILAKKINARVVDIKKAYQINLSDYNTVIIGSSIRIGKIVKKLKNWTSKNQKDLLTKQIGFFICSGDTKQNYIEMNYPAQLVEHAFATAYFGGELNIEDFGAIMRFMLKKKAGVTESYNRLDDKVINSFTGSCMKASA
ncbi:MAG: hypothetical protein JW822_10215 [Spirochaetales bacterium]|nr:hypothetical protein [Spirochaetales bacterium]